MFVRSTVAPRTLAKRADTPARGRGTADATHRGSSTGSDFLMDGDVTAVYWYGDVA